MPRLGLGTSLSAVGLPLASHVTDNLKMLHRYNAGSVVPVSDGAVYFDQSADSHADSASTSTWTGDMTVMWWAYDLENTSTTNTHTFFSIGGQSNSDQYLWCYSQTDDIIIQYDPTSAAYTNIVYSSIYTSDLRNKWVHMAFTFDISESAPIAFYINGALQTISSTTGGGGGAADAAIDSEKLSLGTYNDNNNTNYTKNCYMSNVGVWAGRLLTQSEIKSIMWKSYADLTSADKTSLANWYSCDEGTGTTLEDKGSQGLDLTLSGT